MAAANVPAPLQEFAAIARPRGPGAVKYSALARNTTLRGSGSGPKKWSAKDRWLLARMTGPRRGMCFLPRDHGRKMTLSAMPSVYLVTQ